MNRSKRYSPEVRERAVRLLFEHQKAYRSRWAATVSIATKIGCTPETLRTWVRRSAIDTGRLTSVGTLATGLVHEIKNPLAALQIAAQAALNIKDKRAADGTLERSLQNVVDSRPDAMRSWRSCEGSSEGKIPKGNSAI